MYFLLPKTHPELPNLPDPRQLARSQAMSLTTTGFPDNNPKKYWKEHADEQNQVLAWVQNMAPNSFNQVISTTVTATVKKKPVTRTTIYQVSGAKDAKGKSPASPSIL